MRQTTVQEASSIRFGSAKFEVGSDLNNLVNLGAMRDVVFEETWDRITVMSDNAGEVNFGIRNHKAAVAGDLMEINLANLNLIRGGIDTYSTVAAAPVSGHNQIVAAGTWSYDEFIPFDKQNGAGTKITPTSVTGSTDGALVLNTDYFIVQNDEGKWGIAIRDSSTVTTVSQTITIVHDYTPAASKSLKSGGKVSITPKVVRITNTDVNGNEFRITVYKASNASAINIEWPADEDEDPAMVPIRLEGTYDTAKAVGQQLFEIYDEQNV